jgi:hypothetical protein|tara:strand:- start:1684 stop:2292 length:609 start_codon:yes stop_codon:yes gene_type:complete
MKVKLNSLVRRQIANSEFSHFEGTFEELEGLCQPGSSFVKSVINGYRDGVQLLNVDPTRFHTGIVVLNEGDNLVGKYEARQKGETPRKTTRIIRGGDLCPVRDCKERAKSCQIVLYSHDVLAENNEVETDAEYEIIAINAVPTYEPAPINPTTLMHNHFGSDGGTNTNMTPEEFETALCESFNYWKDKAMICAYGHASRQLF